MNSNEIQKFLISWAVLILVIWLLSNLYSFFYPNPVIRERLNRIEAFQNNTKSEPEETVPYVTNISPSPIDLQNIRSPFALLSDILKPYSGTIVSPTSERCYDADFQTRLEHTGNFRQMTNNYKRGVPDSCSAPNHDLVLSFYDVEPLAGA